MKQFFIVSILIISSIAAHAQINSSDYHTLRNKLGNSLLKFSKNKKATVAFLGGSITYNPGWRDSTCSYLKRKFPLTEFEFIAAGIPSMGSTPGAFRLERDVLSKGKIDLLFVEAAVNDPTNGRSGKEQIRAMEGIIHHARTTNSEMDIIILYFADPDKMASYNKGLVPEVIINH
jgi:sialidase-1